MKFRKTANKSQQWVDYCNKNRALIGELNCPDWVFHSERNFRQFATYGITEDNGREKFIFEELNDALFWRLFHFISDYFDMDAGLFDEFEKVRIGWSKK
jgi:hypothetical protein